MSNDVNSSTSVSAMNSTVFVTFSTASVSSNEVYERGKLDWRDALLLLSFALICIVGVTGNIVVCCIFNRKRDSRSSVMDFLILCLATVDMIASVVNPVMFAYWTITHHKNWHFGYVGCSILPSLTRVLVSFSIGIIIIITLDRYYVICRPFDERLSRFKIYVAVYVALLISVLIDLPYIVHQKVNEGPNTCAVPDIAVTGYAYPMIAILVVRDVVFFFVFIVTISLIKRELFDEEKRRVLAKTRNSQNLRKVTLMLTVMAFLFMILVFPRDIFLVIYIVSWLSPPGLSYTRTFLDINSALKILHMANSIVNVFIYARLHGEFRKHFRSGWRKLRGQDASKMVDPPRSPNKLFDFVDSMINDSNRVSQDSIDGWRVSSISERSWGDQVRIPLRERPCRERSLLRASLLRESSKVVCALE